MITINKANFFLSIGPKSAIQCRLIFSFHGFMVWVDGVHHLLVTVGTANSGAFLHNSIVYYRMYVVLFWQ